MSTLPSALFFIMTTEQKIQAIRTDFLDRDQDNYVRIRRSGRLGWESLLPEGGCYSDLLRDCSGSADIIKEAYGMARDYIVAMDTPFKVTLRLSPEKNCTDSKVVYLATRVFDEQDMSEGQKIDTFLGLAIHEGCHLKWTDFSQMPSEKNSIIRSLINILEDERIERLCGEHMPGYANFLKATKYYMFDRYAMKQAESGVSESLSDGVRLLNAIISMVRYPKALREDDLNAFTDYLFDVRQILLSFPEDSKGTGRAAKDIYEVIRRFFENRKETQEKESGDGDNAEESGHDDGTGQGSTDSGKKSCKEKEDKVNEALAGLENIARDLQQMTSDTMGTPLSGSDMAESVKRDGCQLAGICENRVSLGSTSQAVLYRAPENKESYDEALRKVRKYVPAISKALHGHCTEYRTSYHSMRSGALDTGKLAEAYQGVQNVYMREGLVKSDRMAVCVLVDESGSMYGEKIQAAREVAVLLNESVSSIPAIDLYIYGHTYGDRCRDSYSSGRNISELQVYRERGYAPRKALGSIDARAGNLDSCAIREAAERMRKFSSCKNNLMFVITDGAPNEKYEILTSTVKRLETQGFNIVAVCIEPSYDPSKLYTHHVRFTDMSSLALDLGKMIKKAIIKGSGRH